MKINKRKPSHWLRLVRFSLVVLLTACVRYLREPGGRKPTVILYGHKLNGNLKSFYSELLKPNSGCSVYFLTMDPTYHKDLKAHGYHSLSGLSISSVYTLANCSVIVSDHGLHSLSFLLHHSGIRFVDVWHGIPFKGFDESDFRTQQAYDEIWVSSQRIKSLYIDRFGFKENQVHVTGYGRTDKLIKQPEMNVVKKSLGIEDEFQPVILFAPTWAQDKRRRNLYPFDLSESEFLSELSSLGRLHNCLFLVRHHLNTASSKKADYPHIKWVPSQTHPDTEEILLASDILICDWSSIAFDFLALDRPVLFLDIPPPFSKGLSLPASYRFGHITDSMENLRESLSVFLSDPDTYFSRYSENHKKVKQAVYDDTLDGESAKRYHQRLLQLINS